MMRKLFCLVLLILLGLFAAGATKSQLSFNVRNFGASGDGTTKDTAAFQKALDTCAVSGGGEVVVPAGRYLIGSIQIGTRTILRLEKDSVLMGSPDLEDYPIMDIRWEGQGVDEKGYDAHGKCIVAVDPRYFRPTEVETLLGDPAKANARLGWKPKVSFKGLVAEMVREDLKSAERDELVKKHGFAAYDYHE